MKIKKANSILSAINIELNNLESTPKILKVGNVNTIYCYSLQCVILFTTGTDRRECLGFFCVKSPD